MYLPHAQVNRETGGIPRGMAIVVKTESNPLGMVDAVRRTIRNLDANLPVSEIRTMEQVTARALSGSAQSSRASPAAAVSPDTPALTTVAAMPRVFSAASSCAGKA